MEWPNMDLCGGECMWCVWWYIDVVVGVCTF